jgi:hypothetical protein
LHRHDSLAGIRAPLGFLYFEAGQRNGDR